jgi:hypothetical protein
MILPRIISLMSTNYAKLPTIICNHIGRLHPALDVAQLGIVASELITVTPLSDARALAEDPHAADEIASELWHAGGPSPSRMARHCHCNLGNRLCALRAESARPSCRQVSSAYVIARWFVKGQRAVLGT